MTPTTDPGARAGEKTVGQALYESLAFSGVFCQFWSALDKSDQRDFEVAARHFLARQNSPPAPRPPGQQEEE